VTGNWEELVCLQASALGSLEKVMLDDFQLIKVVSIGNAEDGNLSFL
jgi:hypothetical protein